MSTALALLALHGVVVLALAAAVRGAVARAPARPGPRLRVLVTVLGGAVGLVVGMLAGVQPAVAGWAAAHGAGGSVAATAGTLALFIGPVPLTALGALLGVPGRSSALARGRRFAAGYVVVVGPAILVVAVVPVVPSGLGVVVGAALLGVVVAGGAPLALRWLFPVRRLSPDEHARLAAATDLPVRVVDTGGRHANALAAGVLPGLRYVFVTERLLAVLPPDEAAAIVAHESGHHHRWHTPLRLGAVAAFVLPWLWATATGVPGGFALGAVATVPVAGTVVALARWTEYDADRYAAERVGAATLARALRRLAGARLLASHGGGLLSLHPSTARRVARLEQTAVTPPAGSTGDD